ncbi:MAG: transcription antitermination factor NusB [Gammaproteobacteria bacterium]|nr:transcription antitermination factor NusB [Gammaproteobacteria bacterium]
MSRQHQGRRHARRRALQGLYQWHMNAVPASDIYTQFVETQDMRNTDMEYFKQLLVGVIAGVEAWDQFISSYGHIPLVQMDPVERNILRIAFYELRECLDIPYRVTINEAVELAKVFGAEDGHKYINAVLDKACKTLRSEEQGRP